MPNSPSKALPSEYVIAEPQTYDFFDISAVKTPPAETAKTFAIDAALKATAEKPLIDKPQRKTAREPWTDAGKEPAGGAEVKPPLKKKFGAPRAAIDATAGDQDITREKRAVWVVHGMGQQIPFETLDSLATGLLDALPNPTKVTPRFRTVKVGDQVLQRVELDIDGVDGASGDKPLKKYELHLYETSWAPKTEGVAKLKDVVSFLWDGGLGGILTR